MLIYPIYSRRDEMQVRDLCLQLNKQGFELFLNDTSIQSGELFASQISRYIHSADVVLFFYSREAEQSAWVRREVEYALAQNKRLVPVLLEPFDSYDWAYFLLGNINGCYLYENSANWDRLVHELGKMVNKKGCEASPTPSLEGRNNRHLPTTEPKCSSGFGLWQLIIDFVAKMATPKPKEEKPKEKVIKCFIAGSKALQSERDALRAVASIMYNKWSSKNFRILTYTYEDFDRKIVAGGHQSQYNRFISEEADWALFVINEEIGGITLEEFNTAMDSFKMNGRPKILVMAKNTQESNLEIAAIKAAITEEHQYWSEYSDLSELKHIFEETLNWDLINMYM